jgi:hypothetical protein
MGIFYAQVEVINRTSKMLHCRYDGQDIELEPNYDAEGKRIEGVHNMLPEVAVPYAKSQNVRMGSEDPHDPSEYDVLVGVLAKKGQKQKDDISHLEQSSALTRVKLEDYLDDPSLKITVGGRQVRNSEARPEKPIAPFDPKAR